MPLISSRRLIVAVIAATGLVLAGCSSDSSDSGANAAGSSGDVDSGSTTTAQGAVPELPPPDEADFTGRARVLNLWLDDALDNVEIDVWAGRTFTNGPVLLADNVGFGEVSDYFSVPDGHSIVFTPSGSGPDGEEIGSMFNPSDGEQILAVLNWDEGTTIPNHWEVDPDDLDRVPPTPTGPDEAILALRAGQLIPWDDELDDDFGGRSYYVGDGAGSCIPQTVEEEGFDSLILGGTQPTYHRLASGPATISFHRWPGLDECASDPVFDFEVDITGGEQVWVFVYTPDGESLETLTVPIEAS
jgi:hypothetical protein